MQAQLEAAKLEPGRDGLYQMFFEKPFLPNCSVATFRIFNTEGKTNIEFLDYETPIARK